MPNNKDREKKEFNKPNNGDNFKAFFDVLSDKNGDDMLVDAAMKSYSDELSSLEKQGRDVLEVVGDSAKKLFSKKKAVAPDYLNETNTAPVLTNEAVEHQIKRKTNTAADAVFRPETPSVQKKSTFFKDLKYDVSLDEFDVIKKFSPSFECGTSVDYFDKSVGLKVKNSTNGGRTTFKGAVEYEPFDNTLQMSSRYEMPKSSFDARAYLNKDNPGLSVGYSQQIDKNSCVRANASWFKSDAAFEVDYRSKLKDNSYLSVGAYGSTTYKEVGVRLKWNFYGH